MITSLKSLLLKYWNKIAGWTLFLYVWARCGMELFFGLIIGLVIVFFAVAMNTYMKMDGNSSKEMKREVLLWNSAAFALFTWSLFLGTSIGLPLFPTGVLISVGAVLSGTILGRVFK